jgi:hypothetical protein
MTTSSHTEPTSAGEPPGVADPAEELSQRDLVQVAVVGGFGVVVAGTGPLGYRIYDNAVLDPGNGQAYDPWEHWRDDPSQLGVVSAAILAANPNNTHPWIFELAASSIDVYTDATRDVGTVDPFKREQYVGLGAGLENLALACRARGLEPAIELLPDGPDAARVARVRLSPIDPQPSPLYDAIGQRETNDGTYESRPMSVETLAALVDAGGLDGVTVAWVTDQVHTDALDGLLVDGATALTRGAHESGHPLAWFRRTYDAVARHRDTLEAQGTSPLIQRLAKLLPAASGGSGDRSRVDEARSAQTKTATAYGILTAADPYDRATQLVAGRLLQRIHLTATVHDIALQPMNQITEQIDCERATRKRATFGPRFAELLPSGVQPLVTFRVGYPTRTARSSPLRPVAA